jgi:protein-tyrosine-phosphatase
VCTRNTCRSPLAEAIARRLDHDGNEYASAGRHAHENDPAAANAIAIAPELATHRARQLTPELEAWADRVVDLNEEGIADPYGRDGQAYRETAAELEKLIRTLTLQHSVARSQRQP